MQPKGLTLSRTLWRWALFHQPAGNKGNYFSSIQDFCSQLNSCSKWQVWMWVMPEVKFMKFMIISALAIKTWYSPLEGRWWQTSVIKADLSRRKLERIKWENWKHKSHLKGRLKALQRHKKPILQKQNTFFSRLKKRRRRQLKRVLWLYSWVARYWSWL